MSKVKNSFLDLVGQTPLVRVNNLIKKDELKADVLAKLEYFNPAGSVKDRIAKEMILDALEKGLINENTTLIEPTSGNTGIGLSAVANGRHTAETAVPAETAIFVMVNNCDWVVRLCACINAEITRSRHDVLGGKTAVCGDISGDFQARTESNRKSL